ncbi:hypothetical protein [Roseimicrobium sp. ORNL1]|nr:hypothetical protein [Roseimicrobium sp. ORNL1]QIF05724.1 hypothetical protein G5S37_30905 [Roseimicrobium sp. ORNL1]
MISSKLALAPIGTTEMVIAIGVLGFMALAAGVIIFVVVRLSKKQK